MSGRCIPRSCSSLLVLELFYFIACPGFEILDGSWLFCSLCQESGLPLWKAPICRIHAKAKSFTLVKDVSTCLVVCSGEYWNNIDRTSKNKLAELGSLLKILAEVYFLPRGHRVLVELVVWRETNRMFSSRSCFGKAVNVYACVYMYTSTFYMYKMLIDFTCREISLLNIHLRIAEKRCSKSTCAENTETSSVCCSFAKGRLGRPVTYRSYFTFQ